MQIDENDVERGEEDEQTKKAPRSLFSRRAHEAIMRENPKSEDGSCPPDEEPYRLVYYTTDGYSSYLEQPQADKAIESYGMPWPSEGNNLLDQESADLADVASRRYYRISY